MKNNIAQPFLNRLNIFSKTVLSLGIALSCSEQVFYAQQKHTQPIHIKKFTQYRFPEALRKQNATVRTDLLLCAKEKEAINKRKSRAHSTIRDFVDLPLMENDAPSIGIVCSGGGFKSAVATIGLLEGLEEINLLDGIRYISTLSGSTWSTAAWLTHAHTLKNLELYLQQKLDHAFKPEKISVSTLAFNLITKMQTTQTVSINDVWGGMLGNIFFSRPDDFGGQSTYLSDLEKSTLRAEHPFPLFSAVIANMAPVYQWVEFSPFEVGSTALEAWIPTWAFGRQFNNGVSSIDGHPENFGYLLGLFGSLYATCVPNSLDYIEKTLKNTFNIKVPATWHEYIATTFLGKQRISPPEVYNFTYNMEKSQYKDLEKLTFIDGGIALSLPFPPLMRRNLDVYIVCDAPDITHKIAKHPLLHAKEYAQEHNLAFPETITSNTLETIKTDPFTFFIDQNYPEAPIIIYIQNNTKISCSDLNYTKEDFYTVLLNTKNTVIENSETIKDVIRYAIDIKKLGYAQMRPTCTEKRNTKEQKTDTIETRSPKTQQVPERKFRSLIL